MNNVKTFICSMLDEKTVADIEVRKEDNFIIVRFESDGKRLNRAFTIEQIELCHNIYEFIQELTSDTVRKLCNFRGEQNE